MDDKTVFKAISFASPMGVFQADEHGGIVESSGRWQELLRTGAGRSAGSGWLASVHPQDREQIEIAWKAAIAQRSAFDMEFRVLDSDGGSGGHVRMQARPSLWGAPPRPGYTGVAGDITKRKEVERDLRSANRFLERAEKLSGVGGWEADLQRRTLKWTDQNCRIYDLAPGHEAGFSEHLNFFDKSAQRELIRAARRSLRTGAAWELDLPMTTASGRAIWVRSVGVAEFEGTRAVRLVGALQDITDEQASREALRESEERQKRAMDASRLALWDLDLETGLGYLSENWSELLGGERQVTVTNFDGLMVRIPDEDQARIAVALSAALKGTTERYDIEHQVRRDDGTLIWIHSQGRVSVRDADGRALRATGTNQDITARKLAELELAHAAAITRATVDSTGDGILVVNGDRETLLFNRRFLEMWRIPSELERATRDEWGRYVVDQLKYPKAFSRRIEAAYHAAGAESFDVLEFIDGRVFERHGRPMVLAGGPGRVWSFRDVTVRARADAEIKAAKEAAEAANRAKTDFLDTVSHEIRTPLHGVLGMTGLLLEEQMPPQQRRYVELAHSSAKSLLGLINDLLDLGKIESGRMEFEHVEFSMAELARDLGDLYRLRAREKGLAFEVNVKAGVPGTLIGDPGRVRQVLNNLLTNAIKFTDAGRVGLDIAPGPADAGRLMLRFTVHDTGIGIPANVQRGLFQRFSQADSSTTREYGGTGLGLAIVKQLCEQMGGRVSLESQPGLGASLHCDLPFLPAQERVEARGPSEPGPRAPREPRSERILVAEDNGTNQIVVKGMLDLSGFRDVTLVGDGQQVLDAVARERFDAILMDCRMPVMDGYESASRLRAAGCRIPIIALTANTSEDQRQKCLAAGMDDFLSKPMEAAQLAAMLDKWTRPSDESVLSRQKALERLDGDEALFAQVLQSYVDLAPKILQQVRTALDKGEGAQAHRHLHSLSGSSAMVGAEVIGKIARSLEQQTLEGRLTEVTQSLPMLQSALEQFLLASAAITGDCVK